MKTTLLLTCLLPIAWSSYSQTDTVRLPIETATRIYKELEDGRLAQIQLIGYKSIVNLKDKEIGAYHESMKLLTDELANKNKWYRKPKTIGAVAGVAGLIIGVFIAK